VQTQQSIDQTRVYQWAVRGYSHQCIAGISIECLDITRKNVFGAASDTWYAVVNTPLVETIIDNVIWHSHHNPVYT